MGRGRLRSTWKLECPNEWRWDYLVRDWTRCYDLLMRTRGRWHAATLSNPDTAPSFLSSYTLAPVSTTPLRTGFHWNTSADVWYPTLLVYHQPIWLKVFQDWTICAKLTAVVSIFVQHRKNHRYEHSFIYHCKPEQLERKWILLSFGLIKLPLASGLQNLSRSFSLKSYPVSTNEGHNPTSSSTDCIAPGCLRLCLYISNFSQSAISTILPLSTTTILWSWLLTHKSMWFAAFRAPTFNETRGICR